MIRRLLGLPLPFSARNPVIQRLLGLPLPLPFPARNPVIRRLLGLPLPFPARNPVIRRLLGLPLPFPARNPVIRRLLGLPLPFSGRNPVIRRLLGLPLPFPARNPVIQRLLADVATSCLLLQQLCLFSLDVLLLPRFPYNIRALSRIWCCYFSTFPHLSLPLLGFFDLPHAFSPHLPAPMCRDSAIT
ncbi:hypothetical protein [Alkalihalobacillus pseudalcaliphilus]|uniref:hypothetical protein n=1 Tax=Alkalihalobacillus pseudalcaliphilus TaxID=79884 RepID=UPI002361F29B|nr:hypothetical protein [Alkalihalobacillus pseudalcaliphilus]